MGWIGILVAWGIYLYEKKRFWKKGKLSKKIITSFLLYLGIIWLNVGFFGGETSGDYMRGILDILTGIIHLIFLSVVYYKEKDRRKRLVAHKKEENKNE